MSFWGATVITNFFSAIPLIGGALVSWLWGGFSVGQATLGRFFSLHYLLPFVLVAVAGGHVIILHRLGSINSATSERNLEKYPFMPYFTSKDLHGFVILMFCLTFTVFFRPYVLGDTENFIKANSLVTPSHIVPEWYFLFSYAILRAVPFKLGGLVALIMSLMVVLAIPLTSNNNLKGMSNSPLSKIGFVVLVFSLLLLTWLGAKPVGEPYTLLSRVAGTAYFTVALAVPTMISCFESILMQTNLHNK